MKFGLISCFAVVACALLFSICSCTIREDNPYRVVVFHSYEEDFSAYPHFNKLIQKEFDNHHLNVEIKTLYLDCEEYSAKAELARMYFLIDSIGSWNPDIILVNEDQATYSLLACNHPLVHKIPVVFAGVNYPNDLMLSRYSNVTGFRDKINFVENFNVAREFTNTKGVYLLGDSTVLDMKTREDLLHCLTSELHEYQYKNHLPPTYQDISDIDLIIDSARAQSVVPYIYIQPMKTFHEGRIDVLLWRFSRYGSNMTYLQTKRDYTVYNISSMMYNMSFTAINDGFGFGERLLGGYFTSLETQVADQVGLSTRILNGESPSVIPISDSKKEYLLDWDVMRYFGIKLKDVPLDKYRIVNIPFYNRYATLCNSLLVIVGFAFLLITCFAIYRITKETKLNMELLDNLSREKKLRSMISLGSEILAWRWEDSHFYFEDSFYKMIHRPVSAISLNTFLAYVHPEDRHIVSENLAVISKASEDLTENTLKNSQIRINFKGRYEWWESRHSTILDKNTNSVIIQGLLINIQSHKEHEMELEKARDIADKTELKQSFLSNMSHEIRTPLNAIVGFSNLLTTSDNFTEKERTNFINVINQNSTLMLKLIDDIIDLSKIETKNAAFVYEQISANDILNQAYCNQLGNCPIGIRFTQKGYESSNLSVTIDRMRMAQALDNLIDNSFKFTNKGFVEIGVRYDNTEEVEFYVKDSGLGIDENYQKIIFNRFFKQDEFQHGSGLGLPICKLIVEEMNGRMSVSSSPGIGSTFSIFLPLANQDKI